MALDCVDGLLSHIVLILAAGVPREVDGLDGMACFEFAVRLFLVGGFAHVVGVANACGMGIRKKSFRSMVPFFRFSG